MSATSAFGLCAALVTALGGHALLGASTLSAEPLAVAAAAGQNRTPIDTSKWKTYVNEKHGFEVKYPDTWNVHVGSGIGPEMISIDGPFRGAERPTLSLAIQPSQNSRRRSIEEWFGAHVYALAPTPESMGLVTIGGQPAVFMDNTNSMGKRRDTFTLLHETDVLSLSFTFKAEYDPIYAAMVATFRVVK
jgi:hypothetical protein